MAAAFGTFDEPLAWLIRGLVEYGWRDVSQADGLLPSGLTHGFDLTPLPGSQGRDGILLRVAATVDGRAFAEDGAYAFEVCVSGPHIVARCPDANFIQQYAIDPANPIAAVGALHQAVCAHVPEFVRWRMGGGEVGLSERRGIPEIPGAPCSVDLVRFVRERLNRAGQGFDRGPAEGWWMGLPSSMPAGAAGPAGQPPAPGQWSGHFASVGRGGIPEDVGPTSTNTAVRMVSTPALAMNFATFVFMALSVLGGCGNLVQVVVSYGLNGLLEYFPAVVFSFVLAGAGLLGGVLSFAGVRHYARVNNSPMMWIPIAYLSLVPGCCLLGLPIAGWALYVWYRPEVREVWEGGA